MGCRFSVLLDLPYFDPVQMLLIDPMHNLFLGSAKYFTQKILIDTGVLDTHKLNKRLHAINIPYNIGRLPTKIGSGATFTAHQWMNWTLYFSVFCMHGLIPQSHLECCRSFVLACRRLCRRSLTENDVTVAYLLLVQFCKRVDQIFGHKFVTPNMHLHHHLASCIHDFGPIHAFWLYAFERYNGLLGNLPNNNRAIEIQLMRRFTRDNCTLDLISQARSKGLLKEFGEVVLSHAEQFCSVVEQETIDHNNFTFPPRYSLTVLDDHLIEELKRVYVCMYPQYEQFLLEAGEDFPKICCKYEYVLINGNKLSSSTENCPTYVMAKPLFHFPLSLDHCQPMIVDLLKFSTLSSMLSMRHSQIPHTVIHLQYVNGHNITLSVSILESQCKSGVKAFVVQLQRNSHAVKSCIISCGQSNTDIRCPILISDRKRLSLLGLAAFHSVASKIYTKFKNAPK